VRPRPAPAGSLECLGWRLHRIWSTDWFNHPEREAEKLRTVIASRVKELKSCEFEYEMPMQRESEQAQSVQELVYEAPRRIPSEEIGVRMKIWELTLDEFLTENRTVTDNVSVPLASFLETLHEPGWYEGKEQELPSHPGFATAPLKRGGWPETNAHQMMLQKDGKRWKPVGLHIDDTIFLAEEVRRRGLSAELVLRCVPYRELPERRYMTRAGCAALLRRITSGLVEL
jgi:hypothetical protein